MFGRRFTEIIEGMGGRKVNGRAYYQGVALQEHPTRTDRICDIQSLNKLSELFSGRQMLQMKGLTNCGGNK